MTDAYKAILGSQLRAALDMLEGAIDKCPAEAWDRPVGKLKFCQAAFHVLFYTDLYLEPTHETVQDQPFHRERPEFFGDYEELEPRAPVRVYDKPSLVRYFTHCREKVDQALTQETAESLGGPSGFFWLKFSRAELYLYNLRHVQHHAAQLILRLRLDYDADFKWVSAG